VPEELIELGAGLELSDLGAGPAFGSLRQEVMELTGAAVMDVPAALQQDVLVFDWWIRNGDRLLTEKGGNPNLLWEPAALELVVIDHNQAFDPQFNPEVFLKYHVFVDQCHQVFGDTLRRREYNVKLSSALDGWQEIRQTIPAEWFFADPEMTVPVDFDLDAAYQLLNTHQRDDFWDTP